MKDIVELYRKTISECPADIKKELKKAHSKEKARAKEVLGLMLQNLSLAKNKPKCQDTGTPIFFVKGNNHEKIKRDILEASRIATDQHILRPNSVDPLTEKNIGTVPLIYFKESDDFEIKLMMKGGGSENVSRFYSLPDKELKAERGLEGVKKCVVDAVFKAQGKGCPPYIIGVGVSGSIDEAMRVAKIQLLKKLGKESGFEKEILNEINKLGIGPMGVGGKTTALGVRVGFAPRHPASYFVGVSFGCWTLGRGKL
ncbi:fumarate hydratase [Candidatus Woesearchaeota archaeon]|nr:fumarate hydratase [Candidatus Woesearchaeota archaeon]